ncbi:MAG: hypothetical protein IJN86_01690 [Clostridia bacterium]|nr:hypothetical protein [Clostridia bacterium]
MENIVLPYRIRKRIPKLVVFTVIGIIMLILALLCLFSPFISAFDGIFSPLMQKIYTIIGGVCTPFFLFFVFFSLLNMISPTDAIVITEKGFYERTMADGGVGFIPTKAIVSLKVFGNKKKQFLGIKLDDKYLDKLGKTKAAKRELKSNIESGMPAIIIRDCDISISIKELLDVMLKFFGSQENAEADTPSSEELSTADNIDQAEDKESEEAISEYYEDIANIYIAVGDEDKKHDNNTATGALNDGEPSADDSPESISIQASKKPQLTNIDEFLSHVLQIPKSDDAPGDGK